MGAPRIHRSILNEQHRRTKMMRKAARLGPVHVTLIQDEITRKVLGVVLDQSRVPYFYEKCARDGVDTSHAETFDMGVFV